MTQLKTDPDLLDRLAKAARAHVMTAEEKREQRVGYVWSFLGHKSGLSKEDVRKRMEEMGL